MSQKGNFLENIEAKGRGLYQEFDHEEEIERISYHYEVIPEFFTCLTGGLWNTYSCNIWSDQSDTLTSAQEKKLDEYARLANIRPGDKILDVGCGWGGPLVYLCHKYGAVGKGITISPMSVPVAENRAKKYEVDATFCVTHWKDLTEYEEYDLVMTDEVIVHFNDLGSFFKKCHVLLKPEGTMVNKELHFKSSKYAHTGGRIGQYVNKVFGYTGNYRVLKDELDLLDQANFRVEEIVDIDMQHYRTTIHDYWLKNISNNRNHLISLTSEQYVREIELYLRAMLKVFSRGAFGLHIISAQKA